MLLLLDVNSDCLRFSSEFFSLPFEELFEISEIEGDRDDDVSHELLGRRLLNQAPVFFNNLKIKYFV